MDFDKILDRIGHFGKYQKTVYFLSSLPPILVSMNMLSYVFNSAVPKYRCFVPSCDNSSSTYWESWLNFTIPPDSVKSNSLGSCRYYSSALNNTKENCSASAFNLNRTIACDRWIYDRSVYESTVVTEWNLTCSKDWLPPLSGTIWMLGVIMGALVFGYFSDRFGRRPIIMVSLGLLFVSSIAIPFIQDYITFLVIRFFQAASTSGVYQTLFVLGLEFVGKSKRVLCGIGLNFTFAFGEILLGVIAYFFRKWRVLQLILAIPSVFFLAYYWIIPESCRWLLSKGQNYEAFAIIKKIMNSNKINIPLEDVLKNTGITSTSTSTNNSKESLLLQSSNVSALELFTNKKIRWRSLNIFFNWFMITIGYYGISMNSTNLGGNQYVNFILTSAVELPAYIFCILVLDRIGRKIPLSGCMIIGGLACISVVFVPDNEKYHWVSIMLSLIGKFGCSAAFSIIYVFSAELFPTVLRNNGIGLGSFFAHIGGMLAPYIAHLSTYNKTLPLVISGGSLLSSGIISMCLPETLNQRLPESLEDAEVFGSDLYDKYSRSDEESEALLASNSEHLE